ncbi:hypothetical protein ACA910_012827 [Epithemia clementina (nom. ined.)]
MAKLLLFRCFALLLVSWQAEGLSNTPSSSSQTNGSIFSSRRDLLWKVPLGTAFSVAYGKLAYNAFSTQGFKFPEAHESRVRKTIAKAFALSLSSPSRSIDTKNDKVFRVLEVGIGSEWRLARRGLYASGIQELDAAGAGSVELTGLDLKSPSQAVLDEALQIFRHNSPATNAGHSVDVTLKFVSDNIEQTTHFTNGYFDCIICCFVLCSVHDPAAAVEEMKRLLRPNGGTLGYVEHVSVDQEPYPILKWEQRHLDQLQQAVADNCHLNRASDKIISQLMTGNNESLEQQKERFLVDSMWPTSMQCCGVVQRQE